ncbi:MAG TPA: IPT/TIG domain-containing protein, partial [Pantanalinema sp.]
NAGTTPATLVGAPVYTNHPDAEIAQLATDLLSYLGANQDPLASVPAIKPSITTFSPSTAGINALVQIQGTGFSPVPSGNTVSFNGVPGQVLLAAPTYLVAAVPSGASSGGITVATTRGSVTSGGFTLSLSGTGAGGLVVSSFSPAYGRAGTEVVLSGQFGTGTATPTVTFKGPASDPVVAPVSAWSANAMTVTVPTGAMPGGIAVQSGMATAQSSAPFDVRQGEVSLMNQTYSTNPGGAYQLPIVNNYHSVVSTANAVYVIGGGNSTNGISDVFMFAIRADGSLGAARRVSSLTIPRSSPACFTVGNYLFAAGGQSLGVFMKNVERAAINPDGTLGAWEIVSGATLQTNRYGSPGLVSGSTVYFAGDASLTGLGNKQIERWAVDPSGGMSFVATYSLTVASASATIHWNNGTVVGSGLVLAGGTYQGSYSNKVITLPILGNGAIGDGTASANMPAAEHATGGVVAFNGYLYVWGGNNTSAYTTAVYRAPINMATGQLTGAWITDMPLNTPSGIIVGAAPLTTGNRLWAMGGYNNSAPTAHIQTTTIKADGSLNAWSFYGGMTTWRYGAGVEVLNDKIWFLGGGSSNTTYGSTEYFPVEPNGSLGPSTVGPALNAPRYKAESVVIERAGNRFVYMIGGLNPAGASITSVERSLVNSDGTLGTFFTQPSNLVQARAYFASAVIGDYVYCFGGYYPGLFSSIERALIRPDGSLDPFQTYGVSLPDAIDSQRAIVIGNYVYVAGGATSTSGSGANGLVYYAPIYPDGSIGSFLRGPSMPSALQDGALAKVGNYLYFFGGYSAGASNIVQRAFINPDGTLGAWQYHKSDRYVLPFSASYMSEVPVYRDAIFVVSGYTGASAITSIAQGTIQ